MRSMLVSVSFSRFLLSNLWRIESEGSIWIQKILQREGNLDVFAWCIYSADEAVKVCWRLIGVWTHKVYSAKLIQKPLASLSQFKEGVMVPFQKITEAHIVAKFYTSRKRLSDFGCPRVRGLILTADLWSYHRCQGKSFSVCIWLFWEHRF